MSIESSAAFVGAVFDGAGVLVDGIGRGSSEPVESAAPGGGDCGAGSVGGGVTVGATVGATSGLALDGGIAIGVVAGGDAGSAFCFPPALSPVVAAAAAPEVAPETPLGEMVGAAFGAGTGATNGIGAVVAAGDGSARSTGCGDPLCGCGAFGLFCGGAVGSAGCCHDADASAAGRLS
jgi:hypothetical protein